MRRILSPLIAAIACGCAALLFQGAAVAQTRELATKGALLDRVAAVVMDDFHNFSDLERGIVWEFSLALLPKHVRLLLLSATIGNAATFVSWCNRTHSRLLELVRGHWQIENKSHWVRDVTFDEDRSQVRCGNIPQIMAALRNTVIGLLRWAGQTNIAAACRRLAAQPAQALALIGIELEN